MFGAQPRTGPTPRPARGGEILARECRCTVRSNGASPEEATMIRQSCATVRSMFSRFSAAANASTLCAVTGSHLRSLGSKASNPPLRQVPVD
jgi:hypothetical protein